MPINLNVILENLPDDRQEAAAQILAKILAEAPESSQDDLFEAMGMWEAFAKAYNLPITDYDPTTWRKEQLINAFNAQKNYFGKQLADRRSLSAVRRGRKLFAMHSGKLFVYEFSETDVQEIQGHLNELRSLFTSSDELSEEHRRRLLRRLEQLQTELNKTMSDLDRFWGLVGDAGVAIKKFGNDTRNAALIVAAIYKLTMIIWKAQLTAHGLPFEPGPLLPPPLIHLPEAAGTETI